MFLWVFAGTQRRSGEIAKFQFFDTCQLRGYYIQPLKSPTKMLVFVCVYVAVLSLVFELKQYLEVQPYPEMNP